MKPGKWLVRVALQGIQRKRIVYGTRLDAERAYWELLKEALRERDGFIGNLQTFGDVLSYYVDEKLSKKKSYGTYESVVNRLIKEFGHLLVKDISAELLEKQLLALPSVRKEDYSAASRARFISLPKSAFNFAFLKGKLCENYLRRMTVPQVNNTRDRILNPSEFERLHACSSEHIKPAVLFAYQVPSRRSELTSLKRSHVDTEHGIIYLDDNTTKNGHGRIMCIPDNMREYFKNVPIESEYVFYRKKSSETGWRYLGLGDFKKAFNRAKRLAGLDWLHFHDLRHCAVSQMSRLGVRQEVIMRIGGLKTNSMFHRYRTIGIQEIVDVSGLFKQEYSLPTQGNCFQESGTGQSSGQHELETVGNSCK
ncbi:MAG: site-specific integrase [Fibrobacterota bacterium]